MVRKTNLKDEPKTGLEDTLGVCGLSDLKTSSQMVLRTSLGTNPETVLEDALMVYACDILTHWGRVTHTCVSKLTIIGSDNGLSPDRRQAIIWTNDGILLIGPLGPNFSEILIEIHAFKLKKMHLKMSSGKWRPFCLGLNVLRTFPISWRPALRTLEEFRCLEDFHVYLLIDRPFLCTY